MSPGETKPTYRPESALMGPVYTLWPYRYFSPLDFFADTSIETKIPCYYSKAKGGVTYVFPWQSK